jgi:hypothetical protein
MSGAGIAKEGSREIVTIADCNYAINEARFLAATGSIGPDIQ